MRNVAVVPLSVFCLGAFLTVALPPRMSAQDAGDGTTRFLPASGP